MMTDDLSLTSPRHSAPLSRLEQLYLLASAPLVIYCELVGSVR